MSKLNEITCKHCRGAISLNEEWDRTPDDVDPNDWIMQDCRMCGGSMPTYRRWVDPPKSHSECSDLGWQEQPCCMCLGPMVAANDAAATERFHSRCLPDYWQDRPCSICNGLLIVHVDWEEPPTMHRSCAPEQRYEKACSYCGATLNVLVDWKTAPNDLAQCQPPEPSAELPLELVHEIASVIETSPMIAENFDAGSGLTNGHAVVDRRKQIEDRRAQVESEAPIEIGPELVDAPEDWQPHEPPSVIEPDTPQPEIAAEETPEVADEVPENGNGHEYSCSECGYKIVRLENTRPEDRGLCRKCKDDAVLVSGAIAALRKSFPFDLNVSVETKTRTVTEKVTLVVNAETDEVVAEVKLCDDGIFSTERTAVAYDPHSHECFSKTVFGSKGFFSALQTADTFDRDGNLLQHARPGRELALASDKKGSETAIRINKDRFFVKR